MKSILRYGIAAIAVIVISIGLGVTVNSSSDADSFPAFLGQPQAPSDYPCFVNSGGAVYNICGTTRRFCITLPANHSSNTITVGVRAPDIYHNLACFGQSVTWNTFGAGFTGFRSPGIFGSTQWLLLGTLNVPYAGGLYVCCDLAPTSSVHSVNYL